LSTAAIARQLAELAEKLEAEQSRPKYLHSVSIDPRDCDRGTVHEVFRRVIEDLEQHGWSRNRMAETFRVDPTTLMDWIDTGHRKRNQLPGWIIAAFVRLPDHAWAVFFRELTALRCGVRSDNNGQ